MRLVRRSAAAALVATLAACGSPTDAGQPTPNLGSAGGAEQDGGRAPRYVAVEATGEVLKIRNLTGEEIGYSVLEENVVFIAIIPPCSSPDACPTLKPHETVEVRYEQITGYHEGSDAAIVNAWNYVPDRQYGTRVGRLTQTRVGL